MQVRVTALLLLLLQVLSLSPAPTLSFLQQDQPSASPQTYIYDVEDMDDGDVQTFVYPRAQEALDPRQTYYVIQDSDEDLYQVFNYTDASAYVQSVTP